MGSPQSAVLVLMVASLATVTSFLVLTIDRNAALWARSSGIPGAAALRDRSRPGSTQPALDDRRRLAQLRGVVARQAHVEQTFSSGSPDANNGVELRSETLTRFDEAGTPIEHVARIRRPDGVEVQTNYYSRTEVAFRDAANRRPNPVGLTHCVGRAEPNPGLLLFVLPTLATPEELRAVGYRRTRTPALTTPAAALLDRAPTSVLTNARVSAWVKDERYPEGYSSDVVVINVEDGRIVASSYQRHASDGTLVEERRLRHGPIELYASGSFASLRPPILDVPCD